MSLGEDVILEFAVPVVVERTPAPAVVAGRVVAGVAANVTIRACVQPASGRDLLILEEGLRTRESVSVYTPDAIVGMDDASGAPPDIVQHEGERYQVHTVLNWSRLGGFYKGIAIKVPR